MLHHDLVGRVQSKECYYMFTNTFLHFYVVFYQKIYDFIIFISFFDKALKFPQQNINNQKLELVIRNCHCNYMIRTKLVLVLVLAEHHILRAKDLPFQKP